MASKLALLIDEQKGIERDMDLIIKDPKYPSNLTTPMVRKLTQLRIRQRTIIKRLEKFGAKHEITKVEFKILGNKNRNQLFFSDISEQDAKLYVQGIFERSGTEIIEVTVESLVPGFDWSLIN